MCDQAIERLAVEQDAAGFVVQRAAQAVHQSALAGSVRPDQPEALAVGDAQVDILERDEAAKRLAEPVDGEDRLLAHTAALRSLSASAAIARLRRRACTNPTMPFGAIMTKMISSTPTISTL